MAVVRNPRYASYLGPRAGRILGGVDSLWALLGLVLVLVGVGLLMQGVSGGDTTRLLLGAGLVLAGIADLAWAWRRRN